MENKQEYINSDNEFIELENQLSCPHGGNGIEVGKIMNESNILMTLNSIEILNINNSNNVLEIGHGNCGHLEKLMIVAENIKYYGLEISETMWQEAQKINSNKNAEFYLYNNDDIPFSNNFFDRIIAVNTIYFWSNPMKLIKEIDRTLKPNGICVITFADKDFINKLPYAGNKFHLYDIDEIEKHIMNTNLKIIHLVNICDKNPNRIGEINERKYKIVKLEKLSNEDSI